ncbi:BED-type domain-containing protein [Citrus sinensis]|uniref:BED-type domain-containing protein n=1 Tax=Citrus sinensis TaxID=2711 RepID=A0ACB8N2S8_CITSI|nr:BED-type domain-containing protein [Citrus sinensis]
MVPKKGGMMVVKNENNELIPTRIVTGYRISAKGIEVDRAKIKVIEKLPPPTTVKAGERGDNAIVSITEEFPDEKLLTFQTCDAPCPNEGALRYLIDRVKTWRDDGLVLNGDYLHVRCCAHILNLIVTEGLKELEQSIVSVRNAVEFYIFHVEYGIKIKPAFDRTALEDKLYGAYFNEKEGGKKKREGPPLYSDWENTRRIVKFLKTFHDATLQFSSSLKVTSNICYNLICQIEQSLGSLSTSNDSLLSFMAIKMKEKFNKYWDGYFKINKLLIVASVLDPRGKMKFATHCFEKLYGKDSAKCVEMKEMVKNLLIKLYESYNAQYKPGGSGSASESASGSTSGSQNLTIGSGSGSNFWDLGDDDDVMIEDPFSKFSKAVAVSEGSPELSNELDLYLMEKTEKIVKNNLGTKFDILLWWRVNSANYPILSSIARDVLAIPVPTVASESAFSTRGRILDQYRSSLTPDMVEALVLLQNWLRTSLFEDTTADLNKLVEDNEFMDQLAEVHKTNAIRREISEFTQREDEQFFKTWERFNGLLLKCPHHGYEKWHQCQYFLEGLLPNVQEWLMATSGGELMSKVHKRFGNSSSDKRIIPNNGVDQSEY